MRHRFISDLFLLENREANIVVSGLLPASLLRSRKGRRGWSSPHYAHRIRTAR